MKNQLFFGLAWLLLAACADSKFAGNSTGTPATADAGIDTKTVDDSTSDKPGSPPNRTTDGITNTPNTIVFGGTGVYRVGDGAAQGTSCPQTVFSYNLQGSEYSFHFTVEQDNTSVTFQVGRLCGIDSSDSNHLAIVNVDSGQKLDSSLLPLAVKEDGRNPHVPFPGPLVLNKGKYAVKILSDHRKGPGSDRDDFVVGNIKLQGDKPIIGTNIQTH